MADQKDDDSLPLKYDACDFDDIRVRRFVERASRAKKVFERRESVLDPGEEMSFLHRLTCKALIQEALLEYSYLTEAARMGAEEILKSPRASLQELGEKIGIEFDEHTSKFIRTIGELSEDDDDDDDDEPDDEHENAAVRKFINVYKRARHAYYQTVFALQPGMDIEPAAALACIDMFTAARALYEPIPEAIKSELRTRNTAGKVFREIDRYIKCLQLLVDGDEADEEQE